MMTMTVFPYTVDIVAAVNTK